MYGFCISGGGVVPGQGQCRGGGTGAWSLVNELSLFLRDIVKPELRVGRSVIAQLKAARVGAEPNDKKLSVVCHVNKEKINTVSVVVLVTVFFSLQLLFLVLDSPCVIVKFFSFGLVTIPAFLVSCCQVCLLDVCCSYFVFYFVSHLFCLVFNFPSPMICDYSDLVELCFPGVSSLPITLLCISHSCIPLILCQCLSSSHPSLFLNASSQFPVLQLLAYFFNFHIFLIRFVLCFMDIFLGLQNRLYSVYWALLCICLVYGQFRMTINLTCMKLDQKETGTPAGRHAILRTESISY